MVEVIKKDNFNVSKNDVIATLENSIYKDRYKVYETFLKKKDVRWRRGKKDEFQRSLVDSGLKYFAYIKFYLDGDNKYAIVAGKSGSKKVNPTSGCDLSFSTNPEHGEARRWLKKMEKKWCQTEIIIIWSNDIDEKKNEEEAFNIERYLKETFNLLGS